MNNELIGKTVGAYALLERLGAGGMSTVYRARETGGQHRPVAIKVLPIHLAANELLHQRFLREAQMASRLKHPHILPVYAFGEDEGVPYIAMKLVEGGTLAERIQAGPLPLLAIVRSLAQVGAALDYAHAQGVIHRDIKPQNILFDSRGTAYLADFGIARLNAGMETLTGTGDFVGTAAYASPEQCRGEEITPTSDIYSLGVVLYEMLTGKLPYEGPTPLAIMHQHISEPVPNPLRDRPDLPLPLTDVMRKALAKMPTVRYQTATALSEALNGALRRTLGTGPLNAAIPPIGPDPVFSKPRSAYRSPAMPDELIRNLAPTRPTPPAARQRLARFGYVEPGENVPQPGLDELVPLASAPPSSTPSSTPSSAPPARVPAPAAAPRPRARPARRDTTELVLFGLVVVLAVIVVVAIILAL